MMKNKEETAERNACLSVFLSFCLSVFLSFCLLLAQMTKLL